MRRALIALALLGACAKEKKDGAPPAKQTPTTKSVAIDAAPAAVVTAAPDAAAPAVAAACASNGSALLGAVSRAQNAMDAGPPIEKAEAALKAEACHDGAWFHAAAALIRAGGEPEGVSDIKDALDQGLAADPDDVGLLGYVAYLSNIDAAKAPALPADACDRVKAAAEPELVAYVCGHVHLAAKAWIEAIAAFGAITDPPYPDVAVRLTQAHRGAGETKAAKAAAKVAAEQIEKYTARVGVNPSDAAVLRGQL